MKNTSFHQDTKDSLKVGHSQSPLSENQPQQKSPLDEERSYDYNLNL